MRNKFYANEISFFLFLSMLDQKRANNLMADFLNAHSSTLSVLYNSYCMNVYGSQLWCFNDYKSVERFYIAWRKTIRRIWRIDIRTHNVLTNHINGCLLINLMLEKRCITFIWNFFNCTHELYKTVAINCFLQSRVNISRKYQISYVQM